MSFDLAQDLATNFRGQSIVPTVHAADIPRCRQENRGSLGAQILSKTKRRRCTPTP